MPCLINKFKEHLVYKLIKACDPGFLLYLTRGVDLESLREGDTCLKHFIVTKAKCKKNCIKKYMVILTTKVASKKQTKLCIFSV